MEEVLRAAYAKCESQDSFEEISMPFRLLQSYAYRLHVGNVPKRGEDGRLVPCSSDTLDHPAPALLALQGVAVLNRSLTSAGERPHWEPTIEQVVRGLPIRERAINENPDREVIVATDGGCLRNGTASAVASWAYLVDGYVARAGLVPRFMLDEDLRPTGVPVAPTNNRGELLAVLVALRLLAALRVRARICVLCDSEYTINVVDTWLPKWERDDSIGTKANADLIVLLAAMTRELGRDRIRYLHVAAHREGGKPPARMPDSADELSAEERTYLNSQVDSMASDQIKGK